MVRVWVHSPVKVVNDGLVMLVGSLGLLPAASIDNADVALVDLSGYHDRLPPPPSVASIAIVASSVLDITHLYRLGYRGVLRAHECGSRLKEDLASVARSGWPEPRVEQVETLRPQLTARESQVLGLLMLGLPNKRIASRLGITERTIKHHVSSLMRKYQADGRMGLVIKCHARLPR